MQIRRTQEFDKRLRKLADANAKARIAITIQKMEDGNFGDSKAVGGGVIETRIHYGPGYRVYYAAAAKRSSCCCCAVTRRASQRTSRVPGKWQANCETTSLKKAGHDHQDIQIRRRRLPHFVR